MFFEELNILRHVCKFLNVIQYFHQLDLIFLVSWNKIVSLSPVLRDISEKNYQQAK